ncbi:hypothetical protein O6H91_03G117300 [Diphasiastrum complanatum]|uniref:Uncharacterized protein n=1 Tax=Diphasiastrum complanatum TaxID=34168 RepID=A0ACC2EAV8_DIPCM|nr:hypothetical protein O6H91_03G117300 [Diphasiastrum complanatum]
MLFCHSQALCLFALARAWRKSGALDKKVSTIANIQKFTCFSLIHLCLLLFMFFCQSQSSLPSHHSQGLSSKLSIGHKGKHQSQHSKVYLFCFVTFVFIVVYVLFSLSLTLSCFFFHQS